jgi:hypothetical protein
MILVSKVFKHRISVSCIFLTTIGESGLVIALEVISAKLKVAFAVLIPPLKASLVMSGLIALGVTLAQIRIDSISISLSVCALFCFNCFLVLLPVIPPAVFAGWLQTISGTGHFAKALVVNKVGAFIAPLPVIRSIVINSHCRLLSNSKGVWLGSLERIKLSGGPFSIVSQLLANRRVAAWH